MLKTDKQLLLEARRGKELKDIVVELLEEYRDEKFVTMKVALELDVSTQTLLNWARDLGIDISAYR